jgi:NitT/TauT family transport system substrate-binding protein/putative hydroxymethylpyrimidine transport system substrate-binding protein
MRKIAALLAVAATLALWACAGDDAEPGASREATLVLDFQPNAVHAGIYTALREGLYEDRGVDLEVRVPGASTDAPKLLGAGRAEFAILDIHDFRIARHKGARLAAAGSIVGRPLAAVIAGDREDVRRPRDLEGDTVGVTGLPSDDAVLDSVLRADGADPERVERVTIGFDSVAALSAGRIDAATAFWNAEGVTLRELGVPTREFRVDDYGAPPYPELLLVTSRRLIRTDPELVQGVATATRSGYERVVRDPQEGLGHLVESVQALEREEQSAQLDALLEADAFDEPRRPLRASAAP